MAGNVDSTHPVRCVCPGCAANSVWSVFLCASKFFMTVVVGAAHRLDHRPYYFEVIVEFSGAVHRRFYLIAVGLL